MNSSQPRTTDPTPEYVPDTYPARRYGVSRATWWRWVREGNAPKPYRFTSQCTRWKLSEIIDWELKRVGGA